MPDAVVHVIDDDDAVRDSLAFLLLAAGMVVRTHSSALAFLDNLPESNAGCIVTDIRMPGMTGLELMNRLRAMDNTTPVVIITGHADVPLAVQAMKAGVVDFIEKPFGDAAILETLRNVLRANDEHRDREAERNALSARVASLSPRELQVLERLVAGQPNKAIAHELEISPRTVEVYRANVMSKMRANSLSELVRMTLTANSNL
jgi:two-component system response regulator FixJ